MHPIDAVHPTDAGHPTAAGQPTSEAGAARVGGVVLTGGGAVRLQGADKASIEISGQTLLEHSLAALDELAETVVVGEWLPTSRPVNFTREDPVGGGPAAGLLAGVDGFVSQPQIVVTLAVDMPFVTRATVVRLLASLLASPGLDGVLLGERQYLCAAYRTQSLLAAAHEVASLNGCSMRALVADLHLGTIAAQGHEARDVDTMADLQKLRELHDR